MPDLAIKVWYAERRRFDGGYTPVLYYQEHAPTGKRVDGSSYVIRNVQEVPKHLQGAPFDVIHARLKTKPVQSIAAGAVHAY